MILKQKSIVKPYNHHSAQFLYTEYLDAYSIAYFGESSEEARKTGIHYSLQEDIERLIYYFEGNTYWYVWQDSLEYANQKFGTSYLTEGWYKVDLDNPSFTPVTGEITIDEGLVSAFHLTSAEYFNMLKKNLIFMGSQSGLRLKTAGKYLDEDLTVIPMLEEITVNPATKDKTYKSIKGLKNDGYVGLKSVTVKGVTANVDSNIKAQNIKSGVSILGVEGTYQLKLQQKTVTQSGEFTPDAGYDGFSKVSVNVQQGVFPSGELQITENGEYDVAEKESVSVNVEQGVFPSGTLQITKNGEYDVMQKQSVNVEVDTSIHDKQRVTFLDYDGSLIEEYYLKEGSEVQLINAPTHDEFTFQKWACPIETNGGKFTLENYPVTLMPIYSIKNCALKIEVSLNKATGKSVSLQNLSGVTAVNWGDGYSATSVNDLTHEYANYGKYSIVIAGVTSIGEYIFGQGSSTHNKYCVGVYVGSSVSEIGANAFRYCTALKTLTLPIELYEIGANAFDTCYSLKCVAIPPAVNIGNYAFEYSRGGLQHLVLSYGICEIGLNAFQQCYSLQEFIIPDSVITLSSKITNMCHALKVAKLPRYITSLANSTPLGDNLQALQKVIFKNNLITKLPSTFLAGCYSLQEFEIPSSVTSINFNAFSTCYSLQKIKMPAGITSIASSLFSGCHNLTVIDFSEFVSVPTLSSASAFNEINGQAKIVVPDSLYENWISATNWVTYANYIYKASEV